MEFSLDRFYQLNRRVLIWICLFGLVWLLRDYFALFFLTFVLAFVAVSLARYGQRYLHLRRSVSVILVYVLFLVAIASFIKFVTPAVRDEADTLMDSLPQVEKNVLKFKRDLALKYPSLNPILSGYVQGLLQDDQLKRGATTASPEAAPASAAPSASAPLPAATPSPAPLSPAAETTSDTATSGPSPTAALTAEESKRKAEAVRAATAAEEDRVARAFVVYLAGLAKDRVPRLIALLWNMLFTLLLALLFSFLITLDITRLTAEIQSLRASRLHDFYEQTAQPVVRFAYVLGRAFQAQAAISAVKTFVTFLGLLILGIPSIAMLSLVIFVCSFIPVLGAFIAMVPMIMVALNAGGVHMAVAVTIMVIVVNILEAYLLIPYIYGAHLKLNPVLVLIILFVGHRTFGVWGMLLAVPVTYYLLHDVFGVPVWQGDAKGGPPAPASATTPTVLPPPTGGGIQ